MATSLRSPGVLVSVTDESNYAPNAIGSVGYILVATAQDKTAPGGTAYAAGTLPENAEKIYNITSQRDLVTTFGNPNFATTAAGTPINGDERNEYGLMAAYSLLGVSNSVYIQRADVDLAQLAGSLSRPLDNPSNGAYWFNPADTNWGIYVWDVSSQTFVKQTVYAITSSDDLAIDGYTPSEGYGTIGQFVVNTLDDTNPIFQKKYDNTWNLVGSTAWHAGVPAVTGSKVNPSITLDSFITINTQDIVLNIGDDALAISNAINNANITGVTSSLNNSHQVVLYASDLALNGKIHITNGNNTPLADIGITAGYYNCGWAQISPYYQVPAWESTATTPRPTGSVWQKASTLGSGLSVAISQFNGVTGNWDSKPVYDYNSRFQATYELDPTGGGLNIPVGELFTSYNAYDGATLNQVASQFYVRRSSGPTVGVGATTTPIAPSAGDEFTVIVRPIASSAVTHTYTVQITNPSLYGFIQAVSAAGIPDVSAELSISGAMTLIHSKGGDMAVHDTIGTPLANVGISIATAGDCQNIYVSTYYASESLVVSNWAPLSLDGYTASATQPYVSPADGTLWYYNTPSRADIMISNGSAWVGYRTLSSDIRGYNLTNTNATGPIISTSAPTKQDNGNSLAYGDLWLDTSDLENYPKISRWQRVSGVDQWVSINNTDATSQNGIIFADARWSTTGNVNPVTGAIPTIASLSLSSHVDLDAPSASIYPRGMLLWNTRASGYNVKQYKSNYFTAAAYPTDVLPAESATWVSVAGFQDSAVPNFGRKAPRGVVVAALKAAIDSSTALREDQNNFNLVACPGYPELIPNMISLNDDRMNTAFVVGDTPMRLPATGTDIQAWAQNTSSATATGEQGLLSSTVSPYVGLYYPSGRTNDLSGNSIVVPPSHMALRTIMRSDNIGYPWLAPAGTRRGLIDNASAVGYVDGTTGQFIAIGVTQGLRDVMYDNKINPITNLPPQGLLVYGQKTLAATPSSMDRVNVSRLINYVRKTVDASVRPFLFEPNDPITRAQVIAVINSILNDLVAKRGVTDYLVVCDATNNTPYTIARNELWVDVAIQPTKAVEFIYVPIRLKNAGEIQSGNLASATTVGTGA
jgi:Phage tail sheath C-terminal domain